MLGAAVVAATAAAASSAAASLCGYEWVCMPHGQDEAGPQKPEGKTKW